MPIKQQHQSQQIGKDLNMEIEKYTALYSATITSITYLIQPDNGDPITHYLIGIPIFFLSIHQDGKPVLADLKPESPFFIENNLALCPFFLLSGGKAGF